MCVCVCVYWNECSIKERNSWFSLSGYRLVARCCAWLGYFTGQQFEVFARSQDMLVCSHLSLYVIVTCESVAFWSHPSEGSSVLRIDPFFVHTFVFTYTLLLVSNDSRGRTCIHDTQKRLHSEVDTFFRPCVSTIVT